MGNAASGVSTSYDLMAETTEERMKRMQATLDNLKIDLGGKIMEALQPVFTWLSEHTDDIKAFFEVIGQVVAGLLQIIGPVITSIVSILSGLLAFLRGDWQGAWEGLKGFMQGIWSAIVAIFDVTGIKDLFIGMFGGIRDFAKGVIDTVTGWITAMVDTATKAVDSVKRFFGVSSDIQGVSGVVEESIKKSADALSKLDQKGAAAGKQMEFFAQHVEEAVDKGGDLNTVLALAWQYLDDGKAKYGELSEATKEYVASWIESTYGIKVAAYDVGMAVPEGVAEGIADGTPQAVASAEAMGEAVIEQTEDTLETHSPSRRMMEIGKNAVIGFADGIRDAKGEIDDAVNSITDEVEEAFDSLGYELKEAWGDIFEGVAQGIIDQAKLAEAHKAKLDEIRAAEAEDIATAATTRDEELAALQADYAAGLISLQDYNVGRETALAAYTEAEATAQKATEDALAAEEEAYEEMKKSVWEILKETVRNVLTALKEELFLKAAAAFAEAIALTLALNPGAALKYAEAGAYALGAGALAITGFKQGGIATEEMLARIGDTGVNEAVIPLTATNLAEIGAGIAAASVVGGTSTTIGGTSFTVQINNPTVRSDADIRQIVTGVNDVLKRWERGQGRLAPVGA